MLEKEAGNSVKKKSGAETACASSMAGPHEDMSCKGLNPVESVVQVSGHEENRKRIGRDLNRFTFLEAYFLRCEGAFHLHGVYRPREDAAFFAGFWSAKWPTRRNVCFVGS